MGAIGKRPYSSRGVIVVRSVKQRNLNLNSKSNVTNKVLTEKEKKKVKKREMTSLCVNLTQKLMRNFD